VDWASGDTVRVWGEPVLVPESGRAVLIHADGGSAGSRTIGVMTTRRGEVRRWIEGAAPESSVPFAGQPGSIPACEDPAFRIIKRFGGWRSTHRWYLNLKSIPGYLPPAQTVSVVRKAFGNIAGSVNDCGLADKVKIRHRYRGGTNKNPTLCTRGRSDGRSVVGFGDARGNVGLTCNTYNIVGQKWVPFESDMVLDSALRHWLLVPPEPCEPDEFPYPAAPVSLESVVTHEAGHAFGLDHVNGGQHVQQTMSPIVTAGCDAQSLEDSFAVSSLGLGDVRGLRKLY
jgi:hypothetical protein